MQSMVCAFLCSASVLTLATMTSCMSSQDVPEPANPTLLSGNNFSTAHESSTKEDHSDGLVFYDDFEYEALRDAPYSRTESPFVESGGWSNIKAENIAGQANRASGYLYTVSEIPGYSGSFPGRNSTSVLAIEARPTGIPGNPNITPQTDFYLQYGDGTVPDTIPGNVWFQFWVYSNRYDDPTDQNDQLSEYPDRFKFIYPCNTHYPCRSGNSRWKTMLGSASSEPSWVQGDRTELYVSNFDMDHVARYLRAPQENEFKLGQQDTSQNITPNNWTLVKIHYDTSVVQGRFEVWIKPMGDQWAKVAEWIDGETRNFTWSVAAGDIGGHKMFRMPTTINRFDSWLYLDDFAMAKSEESLPQY